MLHHISLGVTDLQRAITFYDAVLAPLGYVRVWIQESTAGYGMPGGEDKLAIKFSPKDVIAPGAGFHLALTAPSREAVEAFHQAALNHGGKDDGAPGLRLHYGPNYYAAFVVDPEGYRIEAVIS